MPQRWFDRTFELGLGPTLAPELLARLGSTPQRVAEAVRDLPTPVLTQRPAADKWSIQENIGHLFDLEALWEQRLDDYDAGSEVLHPADLENRKTHEAHHNDHRLADILAQFSAARARIVERLARMSAPELSRTARHPRLGQPMSVVDLCYFVAEHDDHHLATINEVKQALLSPR